MDGLSRDLVKSFAEVVNEPKQKEPVRYVRGTITGKGDAKYVQLDGSTVVTPISEVVDAQEGDRVLVSIENHRAVIVGNFTFSPSARQEQEALEKAEGAENTANSAGETANAAQLAAQEASKNANEAMGAASAASSSAAEAKDQAQDAMVAAGNASTAATEAKNTANAANTAATEAKEDAASAQAAVANANSEISKINGAIKDAQDDIDAALEDLYTQAGEIDTIKQTYSTKVETNNVKAELTTEIETKVGQLQTTITENYYTKNEVTEIQGNLQSQITQNAQGLTSQASKIEQIESDTAEAQEQVDQALQKAAEAQSAAQTAQSNAATAQEAAETAQAEADIAAQKAQNANDAALDAKLAAHVADEALADAREALDQARENYKNIVSNPGSTAEDIADAAAQVETARIAVETALEDAAEAQYVANQAQEAADNAQQEAQSAAQAAQTAQNKADAAEQAANNAQAAAEQAAENVAALTKRVTTAETKIDQNAEQISLNATKTEEIGDKLVNDYYSKTETDALIKVESDRITSTVSKVETVEKTAITSTIEEFYLSSSPTSLSGGSWVTTQPTWTQGKYIWRRMKVTKGDGTTSYSPSQNGVCITGNTGAKGIQGPPGEDGESFYTWVKYADTPTSGMSDSPTGKEYIGLAYNKSTATESTNYSDYSWSKIVGEQGPEGPSGEDGQTLYTWIKYADSATGSGMSDSPTGKEYIGIAYNKTTSTESNTASDYSWSLIKGADGADGQNGVGIQSTVITYQASISGTTPPTGTWSSSIPTVADGSYLWTRTVLTYTNSTSSTFYAVSKMGKQGAAGSPGQPGKDGQDGSDGKSVSSMTTEFYLSTSKTAQTGGSWTTTMPTWTTGKYLWTRYKIVYTNPSSTAYTTPVCDSSWEAVNEVEKDISQIETRITSAEQKITDDAIVSTVRKSTLYKNDLNGKVDSTEIISTINQTAESIKIQASKIKLEGLVTANNYFKILTDGSIEAVNGKFKGDITATSGTIGGWTIQKDSLTCVSHNDGFDVTYTTYIDANNGLIKFLGTSNEYETIISINGMEMHAGRQDGDRWIYDDIYYGVNGISKIGTMTGETFSLDAHGVSFGLTHNLVTWSNGGGFIATNDEVRISNNCTASTFYTGNWFRSTGQTGWYNETYGGGIWMTDSSWVRVYNNKSFLCNNSMRIGEGNQNTIITSNWIGFYRASDGARVGWMGANSTNDLYISSEKGRCYIGSNLYVASDADMYGYYLQINSGGGTYAGNGYIFVNSSNGYLALGQGDAYVGYSGGRLYLKPQNQVTYDMFVEPKANRKTTLGSSGKRFYRLYTGLAVDVSSDRRIKEDFTTFDDRYLRLFELLQPTIYKLKYLPEDKSKIGGFIAQDVEEAMKQCGIDKREFGIYKYDSENDEYSLIYDMFIPLTVHYVQEQSKLVNHLKNEVALLKSKINI